MKIEDVKVTGRRIIVVVGNRKYKFDLIDITSAQDIKDKILEKIAKREQKKAAYLAKKSLIPSLNSLKGEEI